jgi:predicted aspartyl protease
MSLSTYPYDTTFQPPMPVVDVQFQSPGRATLPSTFSALLDSGADGTMVPIDLLEAAEARCVGEARLRGITGAGMTVDVYVLNIRVGSHRVCGVRVVAVAAHTEIVLGRNVLNHLIVTLNGLAGVTEISA